MARLNVLALLGTILVMPPPLFFSVATASSSEQDRRPDDSLDLVIDRAALAATAFERRFASVVAEERLEQRTSAGGQRVLRSDLLLVRIPGRDSWLPFRDVFEVNGRPVRNRSDRLQRMFAEGSDSALADARRITEESSRYNIGSVTRTINIPTFAHILLRHDYVGRFRFSRAGDEIVSGVSSWRVRFVERARPTLVKTLGGGDVPIEGALWIEPRSGRLLKSLVKTRGTPDPGQFVLPSRGETMMWVVVTYAPSDSLGIWVPTTMSEWARDARLATVSGEARYSNFRRFEVTTKETFAPSQER